MKKRITTFVSEDVKSGLEKERDGRSLSNHVANVLTKHVSKQESKLNSKKEYGKDN